VTGLPTREHPLKTGERTAVRELEKESLREDNRKGPGRKVNPNPEGKQQRGYNEKTFRIKIRGGKKSRF